jgi:hypothetical protein
MRMHRVYAPAVITLLALADPDPRFVHAQRPSDDVTPLDRGREETPRSKTDAHRFVGKVLEIDRAKGVVTLQTEEGTRVVKPSAQLLAAIQVGDTISVPRSGDEPANASPRSTK